ncbi:MAG TPA: nicotinate-nucleotide adenylyltransferase [bacterium]|nr:nicotinate-nucleotide adenylyltransferase [bacterium]
MNSVALFGGTFNPIHYGHLALAEEVRTKFNLDKVVFVPSGTPPHKKQADLAEAKHRFLMTNLATVGNPCFEVSSFEIDKGGKSYSIDTVNHFREAYGDKVQLYFIVGADALLEIATWKNISELVKKCRFIVVPRPGYDLTKILNYHFLGSETYAMASELLENVLVGETAMLDISATAIRKRVAEWKSIKYLVPEPVEQYIHHQKLYV